MRYIFVLSLNIILFAGCSKGGKSPTEIMEVKPSHIEIPSLGGSIQINVSSTTGYRITINADWITADRARDTTDKAESFIVSANPTAATRQGTIRFTLGDISKTVTIKQAANINTSMPSDAMTLASKITLGWNLGNSLEATDGTIASETLWGNPVVSKSLIDAVKAAGFNAVRIPCAWNAYIENTRTYKIRESWLKRVQEVVNYCIENDMYAVVNIHWDGGWLESNCTPEKQNENNRKQHALWTQIATHFRDYGEQLLFAGANEPNVDNTEQMKVLKSYLQTFIDAVRTTGGNNSYRNLIIQGPSTDILKTYTLMHSLPSDPVPNRLMIEVHYYTPWNFCGLTQDESWGKMFYYWGQGHHVSNSDRNATWGEEAIVNEHFGWMKTHFIDNRIPVILGEYGAIKRILGTQPEQDAHNLSRTYFLEYVTRKAKQTGIVPFYWDNGAPDFRIFNRNTKTVADQQALDAIINAAIR